MRAFLTGRGGQIWLARASRVLVSASRRNSLSLCSGRSVSNALGKVCDREDPFASTRDARATHAARGKR
jgi:hypothetical protein